MNRTPVFSSLGGKEEMEAVAAAEVFEPLELHYSDMLLMSSFPISASLSSHDLERIESISDAVMLALGPSGPGLLSITGVPKAPALRHALLPIARKLALLGRKERAQVLKDNGLGSDVPLKNLDRSVSSFAMQLKYEQISHLESASTNLKKAEEDSQDTLKGRVIHDLHGHHDDQLQLLGYIFKELGVCMMELGLRLALICDKVIGGRELEQSILDSGTAKGRLIHYHSLLDNLILKEESKRTKGSVSKAKPITPSLKISRGSSSSDNKEPYDMIRDALLSCRKSSSKVSCKRNYFTNLWQQWHYDYGLFTVLTTPLFMSSCWMKDSFCVKDCSPPDEHMYLQLFDSNSHKVLLVKASPESFIIQVGESADILSNGKLRSILHSVGRPSEMENLSRETFVVFLQPPWDKVLPTPSHLMDAKVKDEKTLASNDAKVKDEKTLASNDAKVKDEKTLESNDAQYVCDMVGSGNMQHQHQKIFDGIPPLSSRLRCGMTFAEFSRETTKQYYGGSGTQSGRQ